jgi:hypothetical protein
LCRPLCLMARHASDNLHTECGIPPSELSSSVTPSLPSAARPRKRRHPDCP